MGQVCSHTRDLSIDYRRAIYGVIGPGGSMKRVNIFITCFDLTVRNQHRTKLVRSAKLGVNEPRTTFRHLTLEFECSHAHTTGSYLFQFSRFHRWIRKEHYLDFSRFTYLSCARTLKPKGTVVFFFENAIKTPYIKAH